MTRPVYLITGGSGSGKTLLATLLHQRGHEALDADATPGLGAWFDTDGNIVPNRPVNKTWLSFHRYLWNKTIFQEITAQDSDSPLFICGAAGNFKEFWPRFKAVFYLEAPVEILLLRSNPDAPGPCSQFASYEDKYEVITEWEPLFKAYMISLGAKPIDANRQPLDITLDIISNINVSEKTT